jgi:hypothetical protein
MKAACETDRHGEWNDSSAGEQASDSLRSTTKKKKQVKKNE